MNKTNNIETNSMGNEATLQANNFTIDIEHAVSLGAIKINGIATHIAEQHRRHPEYFFCQTNSFLNYNLSVSTTPIYEWNKKALSRKLDWDKIINQPKKTEAFPTLTTRYLIEVGTPAICLILIICTLFKAPLQFTIAVALFFIALFTTTYTVTNIIRKCQVPTIARPIKIMLYAASMILVYEVFILFSLII